MSARNWMLFVVLACLASPTVAATDHYTVDPDHTFPSLEMTHLGISVWRGKFNKSSGKIALDRAAHTGSAEIQVEAASIDFGLDAMNEFAVRPDWLDAEKFPTLTYRGEIVFKGEMPDYVDGQLSLRGVIRPLRLKINSFKCVPHPLSKKELCGADAEGALNRADFGMTQYSDGEMGKLHLRIQVEALKDDVK